MVNLKSKVKNEVAIIPKSENTKEIENHRKAAYHLGQAAKNHKDAAQHHKYGNHQIAAHCTTIAQDHVNLAQKTQLTNML